MITKEFINDLKKADNVSIRIKRTSDYKATATLTMTVKEKKNRAGWIKPEIRTEHNSIPARLPESYNEAWFWDSYKDLYGFQTLQHILKPGDELKFNVSLDGCGYLDKAMIPLENFDTEDQRYHTTYNNLYYEVITAKIIRKNKPIVTRMYIGHQISVDNSARMLK